MKTIISLLFLSLCFLGCEKKDSGSSGSTPAGTDAGAGATTAGATTAGADTGAGATTAGATTAGAGVNPNTDSSPNPQPGTFVEVCDRTKIVKDKILITADKPDCESVTKDDLKKNNQIRPSQSEYSHIKARRLQWSDFFRKPLFR